MRVVQEPSGRLFGELVDPAGNVRMRQPIQAASPNAFLDEIAKLEKAGQPVNMRRSLPQLIKRRPLLVLLSNRSCLLRRRLCLAQFHHHH
jgi:hypothetical protein